jgi:hypothetical protein
VRGKGIGITSGVLRLVFLELHVSHSLSRRYFKRKAFHDKFLFVDEGAPGVVLYFSSNFVLLLGLSIANLSVLPALIPGCILLNNALLSVSLYL